MRRRLRVALGFVLVAPVAAVAAVPPVAPVAAVAPVAEAPGATPSASVVEAASGVVGPWALEEAAVAAQDAAVAAQEGAAAQEACPEVLGAWLDAAWEDYRAGRIAAAGDRFERAEACDPSSLAARVGLGYVALRRGRTDDAARLFRALLEEQPNTVDASVGAGIAAWRRGELESAEAHLVRALGEDPAHAEARSLLERVRAALAAEAGADSEAPTDPGGEASAASRRPPLVRPDTVEYPARAQGDRFEVRTADGWRPFYVRGVNLGAALPGRHPSQFPGDSVYGSWIAAMGEMGVNAVRLYTIHPPGLYRALARHNAGHPERPIWLIHGVWTELPPEDDYLDPEWERGFFAEMRRVVDVIHGRADLPLRAGHASGRYTADVSPWTLAYIIGREWEPFSVEAFNRRRREFTAWSGRYLRAEGVSPMDAWLARACERIVAYEVEAYRAQRPVAYTNWPTLDPIHHPTETTVDEELALRRERGETVDRRPREYDNDAVGLAAFAVRPTDALPAGYFAAYHAYPYYPDFMALDPEYGRAASPNGPSNYFGYLRELKSLHPGMPVLIAEYGVPASLGIAHLQPQGWHHGGHDEASMAEIDVRLTREIAAAGMAGGVLFAWIDEWFKKNWITIGFEIPLDRNRLWLNRLDAEQHYGMIAMEPGERLPGRDLRERLSAWREVEPLYASAEATLRALADEAYLWLLFEPARTGSADLRPELLVGFDTVDPTSGDVRWPGRIGPRLPVGVEFVLRAVGDEVRLLADAGANPFRFQPVRTGMASPTPGVAPVFEEFTGPPGFFLARSEQRFGRPYVTAPNADGAYDSLRVITNRPRFARDGSEYLGFGYDRGVLPPGPPPDGLWERLQPEGTLEVRIPWGLVNVTDPSRRRVLWDSPDPGEAAPLDPNADPFGTVTVEAIGIVAAARDDQAGWTTWPASGDAGAVARFGWPTWEVPSWRARRRPVFDAMHQLFEEMRSEALARSGRRERAGSR